MPRWAIPVLLLLASLALVPVALIARARAVRTPHPRVHLIPDMDNQPRYKAQQSNGWFADTRADRLPVAGTVARGRLQPDDRYALGLDGESYTTTIPVKVDEALMTRGKERYGVYCAPCHGLGGYGDGIVGHRAEALQQGAFVPPASLHAEPAYSRPVGHLFNTITNGIRTMPSYGSQVPVEDRWAIVAYIKALQRSQRAGLDDVPPEERQALR
jgi:mono/diheme cytochrome c family protein